MSTHNSVRQAVRLALWSGAAVTVAASQANAADDTIQEVVVTGSRIAQPNLTTTSPITQVTAEDVAVQGVTKIEDLVNQLPQAFAAQNATVANGATGTATVNLRGLGSQRTLVLVDGRRMPYGGVTNSAADLNQIPTMMVERVEVLTGGASAVYGSDAIGGVVNFIMKKDFEGVQFDVQGNLYQHNNDFSGPGATELRDVIQGRSATNPSQFALPDDNVTDGEGFQASMMMGASTEDGRGNITAYVTYSENKKVLQRDRDFSACTVGANPTTSFTCGGSGTSYPGQFTDFGANNNGSIGLDGVANTADDIPDTNPLPSYTYAIDSDGDFRNFSNALDQYNFGPVNHFLRPDNRYSLGALGHYELSEHADVYAQLMFTDDRSVAQIAPGGAFFDTATINCDNPYLVAAGQATQIGCGAAAQLAATTIDPNSITPENPAGSPFLADPNIVPLYIGRRNVEGGGRQQDFHNTSFRALVGTRGAISDGWDYDVSLQYSRTSADQLTKNYFAINRLTRALNAVNVNGVATCQSVIDGSDPLCVPYAVFDADGVTQEQLNYLQAPGLQQGVIDQSVAQAIVTGDLGTIGAKLPWADDSIKIALGFESRHDKLENVTDDLLTTAGLSGTGGATIGIEGSTNVNDIFTELNVPLVQGKTGAEQLGLELAYRYSEYDSGTNTDTYKIGADWAPVEDIRFRASYQRAVRAANIIELFTAQGFNLFDMDGDPCGAALNNSAAAAPTQACLDSGVPVSQLRSTTLDSPAGQYNFTQGGFAGLAPEESDTYSYGFVFTPRFAPGLSVSVDYFDISVENLVSTYGAENTLNSCYQLGDADACSRIRRNPENGTLWVGDGNVLDLNTNIGGLETSGVDLNLNYASLPVGNMGSLSFNLTATYLLDLTTDLGTPGAEPFDCTGYFAGACVSSLTTAVNPELRTRTRIGWATPWNVDLSMTWRYISAVEQYEVAANRIDKELEAEHYFDLFGSWQMLESTSVRMGINNVLDNDPSINASVGTTGNGNTYPQVYDALGRYIFAGVTVTF